MDSPQKSVSFSLTAPVRATPLAQRRRPRPDMILKTPSSCASGSGRELGGIFTPNGLGSRTPEPQREDLKLVEGGVRMVLFDFDGTLTSVPGEKAKRRQKKADLGQRAPLLQKHLQVLKSSGIVLGIITKSQEDTVRGALEDAGLDKYFQGPVIGKAIGFEGKAGFIEDLLEKSDDFSYVGKGEAGLGRVLLVDDDVRELGRAQAKGIQTFPAPQAGGLQEDDFAELLGALGLEYNEAPPAAQAPPPKARPSVVEWFRLHLGGGHSSTSREA